MDAVKPAPFRWTAEAFYRLLDAGYFDGRRVELIDGEIVEMPSQKNYHGAALTRTADALKVAFGTGYWVRVQLSLDLSPRSVPDPDVAVIQGSPVGITPTTPNPTSALIVAEVSDTTLGTDRNWKSHLYAAAGIADYWIVNLVQRQLEVYRNPVSDASAPFGARYADRVIFDPGDNVTPLATPTPVAVADLLP
jgi:Uma2 family endonuclease